MTQDEIILAQQARIEQLCNFIKHAQVSSGVCCCGDGMEGHPSPMACGHSPVDMWDYHSAQLLEAVPDDLSALRAHDTELLAPYQWQPIETAPKDGTAILISNGKGAWVAKYKDVYQSGFKPNNPWLSLMLNKDHIPKRLQFGGPTHWMPLPSTEAIEKGGV